MIGKVEIAGLDTSFLPKLTNAEQLVMLAKVRNGCKTTRQDFIHANMRLVLSVIQRYINKRGANDDIFQVGCVGLIKAIDNFDPRFNVQFSTYAVPMIIGEIRRFLRDTNSLRVSRSLRDTAYRALQAKEEFLKQGIDPSIDEIARAIDASYKQVFFALNATSNTISLDDVIYDEGRKEVTMMEKVAAGENESEKWIEDVILQRAMNAISPREKQILVMRYFLGKTQIEVSNEVGISQAQVSRLEKNALAGVKVHLQDM